MDGFDDPGIYYSDQLGSEETTSETIVNNLAIKKKFKEFIRQFHEGNFNYKYRYTIKFCHEFLPILSKCFSFQRCTQAAVQLGPILP